MATVTYDRVTKRFDNVVAVNDFTLEIPDKEFLVLVGPSGCGKSRDNEAAEPTAVIQSYQG